MPIRQQTCWINKSIYRGVPKAGPLGACCRAQKFRQCQGVAVNQLISVRGINSNAPNPTPLLSFLIAKILSFFGKMEARHSAPFSWWNLMPTSQGKWIKDSTFCPGNKFSSYDHQHLGKSNGVNRSTLIVASHKILGYFLYLISTPPPLSLEFFFTWNEFCF